MPRFKEWLAFYLTDPPNEQTADDDIPFCHSRVLALYLDGSIDADTAADQITAPIPAAGDAGQELFTLWALLGQAMVESPADRGKVLDLLRAIRSLPTTTNVNWQDLPLFDRIWYEWHRVPHRYDMWDLEFVSQGAKAQQRICVEEEGKAEAEMYGELIPAE